MRRTDSMGRAPLKEVFRSLSGRPVPRQMWGSGCVLSGVVGLSGMGGWFSTLKVSVGADFRPLPEVLDKWSNQKQGLMVGMGRCQWRDCGAPWNESKRHLDRSKPDRRKPVIA